MKIFTHFCILYYQHALALVWLPMKAEDCDELDSIEAALEDVQFMVLSFVSFTKLTVATPTVTHSFP